MYGVGAVCSDKKMSTQAPTERTSKREIVIKRCQMPSLKRVLAAIRAVVWVSVSGALACQNPTLSVDPPIQNATDDMHDGSVSMDGGINQGTPCRSLPFHFDRKYFSSGYPLSAAYALDLDRDQNQDLVMIHDTRAEVTVLFGDGQGGSADEYVTELLFSLGTMQRPYSGLYGLSSADLDKDGYPELLIATGGPSSLNLLPGSPMRAPTTPSVRAVGDGPAGVAAGHLDNNTYQDIAVANSQAREISLFFGSSTGLSATRTLPVAGEPSAIAIADFDGDGFNDIAVTLVDLHVVRVLFGDGLGGFSRTGVFLVGQEPRALVAADFDLDGHMDLATANVANNSVSLLVGARGGFTKTLSLATGAGPLALDSGDLNCDRYPDLVVANVIDSTVQIFLNDGRGLLTSISTAPVGKYPSSVTLTDFNNDNVQDIVLASKGVGVVSVLLNRAP